MQLIFFCSPNMCKVTAIAMFPDSGIILNLWVRNKRLPALIPDYYVLEYVILHIF